MENLPIKRASRLDVARDLSKDAVPTRTHIVTALVGVVVTIGADWAFGLIPEGLGILWRLATAGAVGAIAGWFVIYLIVFGCNYVFHAGRESGDRAIAEANRTIPLLAGKLDEALAGRPEISVELTGGKAAGAGKTATDLVVSVLQNNATMIAANMEVVEAGGGARTEGTHALMWEDASSTERSMVAGGSDRIRLAYHEFVHSDPPIASFQLFAYEAGSNRRRALVNVGHIMRSEETAEPHVEFRITISTEPQLKSGPWSGLYRIGPWKVEEVAEGVTPTPPEPDTSEDESPPTA